MDNHLTQQSSPTSEKEQVTPEEQIGNKNDIFNDLAVMPEMEKVYCYYFHLFNLILSPFSFSFFSIDCSFWDTYLCTFVIVFSHSFSIESSL